MDKLHLFIILAVLFLITGCAEERFEAEETEDIQLEELEEEQYAEKLGDIAYDLEEYKDEQNGYSISIPEGWDARIENNRYLYVSAPDMTTGVMIWPVVLEGKYRSMTVTDLTNYIAGLIVRQYPDFKIEKAYKGVTENSMEVIGTFTVNKMQKKISLFTSLQEGYGIVSGYEALAADFNQKEPVLREILLSYKNIKSTAEQEAYAERLQLAEWSDGIISIQMPEGWVPFTGGQCSTKYIKAQDPKNPANQIFYFAELGPFYLNEEKKQFDQWYVGAGGYNLPWIDAPVIQPATPEKVLKEGLYAMSGMQLARQLNPHMPKLENVNILSEKESGMPLGYNGQQKVFTAEFEENGIKGKGQFLVVTTEFTEMGLGYAMMVTGVSASPEEFDTLRETLLKSLDSFTMDQGYISNCIAAQNEAAAGALKAGKTLGEASDIIMSAYETRQESMDRINEQWSDVMLGRERLYDLGAETVYSVPSGFTEYYNANREQFEQSNLQELPEDKWNEIPLDGETHIR